MKNYRNGYLQDNSHFIFTAQGDSFLHELPAGCYELKNSLKTGLFLQVMEHESDEIIDLPTKEFELLINTIEGFFNNETRVRYKNAGIIYKLSTLIYGKPGVGKTALINRTIKKVIDNGGVVIFNPNLSELYEVIDIISETNKNKVFMVVLEEFEQDMEYKEKNLLHILDGEKTKDNMLILATTNFLHKVPPRILRPGRLNYLIEVLPPSKEAKRVFLETKLPNNRKLTDNILERSEGFNIDELKQVIVQTYCLNQNLDEVIDRMNKHKAEVGEDYREYEKDYDKDEEDDF